MSTVADPIDTSLLREAVSLRSDGIAHATIRLCDEVDHLRAENDRLRSVVDAARAVVALIDDLTFDGWEDALDDLADAVKEADRG